MAFYVGFDKVAMAGALTRVGGAVKNLVKSKPLTGIAAAEKGVSTVSGANRGSTAVFQHANSMKDNAAASRFMRRYEKAAARPAGPQAPKPKAPPKPGEAPKTVAQPKPAGSSAGTSAPQAAPSTPENSGFKPHWGHAAAAGAAGGYLIGSSRSSN